MGKGISSMLSQPTLMFSSGILHARESFFYFDEGQDYLLKRYGYF